MNAVKRAGVTVVEILVVMTILLILVAILFPVFMQAKGKSKETVCVSNMKQLFYASQMYREDYGDYPPITGLDELEERYLSGTSLKCFAQLNNQMKYDYLVVGPPLSVPSFSEAPESYASCKAKRGSAFPVVIDTNHANLIYGEKYRRRPVFLIREAGNADTVMVKSLQEMLAGKEPPCDLRLGFINL